MPYPGNTTPEGIKANMEELHRWGNNLPLPAQDTMTPYFVTYAPDPSTDPFDVDFKEVLALYGDDKIPGGMWLCGMEARVGPAATSNAHWDDRVGLRVTAFVNAENGGRPTVENDGVIGDTGGLEAITDITIDFVGETYEITREWYVPVLTDINAPTARSFSIFKVADLDGVTVNLEASAEIFWMDDPTTVNTISFEPIECEIYAWAYRLTDYYGIPRMKEDVTDPP